LRSASYTNQDFQSAQNYLNQDLFTAYYYTNQDFVQNKTGSKILGNFLFGHLLKGHLGALKTTLSFFGDFLFWP